MSRSETTEAQETTIAAVLRHLTAVGDGAPELGEKLAAARSVSGQSAKAASCLLEGLVREVDSAQHGLQVATRTQAQLAQLVDKVTGPVWHPAVFLGQAITARGTAAMVRHGSARRVVAIADDVDAGSLRIGDEVLLAHELNVLLARSPYPANLTGETAVFDRRTSDGRLVVRWRDEEVVVEAAASLADLALENGDLVRWERDLRLAFEKIECSDGRHLFLESAPAETFADIGGLDSQIDQLQQMFLLVIRHSDVADRYGLRCRRSVLLIGPPGTGKTMLARALANWIAELCGSSRFIHVKPSALLSCWYGETERNYREAFRAARAAAEPGRPVVIFFDEIDAQGAARGASLARIDDRVLQALMAELDGLEPRGNVFVVAATNRADALDPALLRPGRLGDLLLDVPRPTREASRDILGKYVARSVPLATNGESDAAALREKLIDGVVSRIHSPNGAGELARITLRSGTQRGVTPSDLVSGAALSRIAGNAVEKACRREIETGQAGLRADDLLGATEEVFQRAAEVLTPANCARHVGGLPQDDDVVRVERVSSAARRAYRYLRLE